MIIVPNILLGVHNIDALHANCLTHQKFHNFFFNWSQFGGDPKNAVGVVNQSRGLIYKTHIRSDLIQNSMASILHQKWGTKCDFKNDVKIFLCNYHLLCDNYINEFMWIYKYTCWPETGPYMLGFPCPWCWALYSFWAIKGNLCLFCSALVN